MSLQAVGALMSYPSLPLHLRGLGLLIADCHNAETGQCNPSIEYLSSRAGISDRGVRKGISKLVELGVLSVKENFVSGRQAANSYLIRPYSVKQAELQDRDGGELQDRGNQEEVKEKEKKGERYGSSPMRSKRRAFKKPSVDDVKAYCQERGNTIEPSAFIDWYESTGWMVGKNKMKCWKSAVRTWERRSNGGNGGQSEGYGVGGI